MARNKSPLTRRVEYALAASLLFSLEHLPLNAANVLARFATRLLDIAIPKLRRVGLINLGFAYPASSVVEKQRIIDGVFRSMARLLVAIARIPALNAANIHELIRYEGFDNYRQAKAEGKGILIATAHLGNWELSAFAHALMTEPMNVLIRPLDNPLIDEVIETRRAASGNRLITKKEAARRVLRVLSRNEPVGILIDQNTTPAEGVFIRFFGREACAGSAFVKLANHSGAAVIPGFALWDEPSQRYILRFYPKVEMTGDAQADAQRIHSVLEDVIRQHPEQWMWIHRRWKTRPPGEPPIY